MAAMHLKNFIPTLLLLLGLGISGLPAAPALESGWENPPPEARLRAYWWWLNGNVTKAAITRDLEQMKAKGYLERTQRSIG